MLVARKSAELSKLIFLLKLEITKFSSSETYSSCYSDERNTYLACAFAMRYGR